MGSLGRTLIATALMTGVVAGPAAAATMQATYTGTVVGQPRDDYNIFGSASDPGSLVGMSAVVTFVFDTTNSLFLTETVPGGVTESNRANSSTFGLEGYMSLAQIVLNGVTYALNLAAPPPLFSSAFSDVTQAVWEEFDGAADGRYDWGYGQQAIGALIDPEILGNPLLGLSVGFDGAETLPNRLDTPFAADLTQPGWFNVGGADAVFQALFFTPDFQSQWTTDIRISQGSISVICLEDCGDDNGGGGGGGGGPDPSVIPLPASGLLLLAAGGALGALRRRKTRVA